MTAAERAELAVDLFEQGYNCAQSVVGAWLDQTEMDSDQAMRLASSFGGGMGWSSYWKLHGSRPCSRL